MATVKVYRARTYDITIDDYRNSHRWMTENGAAAAGLEVIYETVMEIDEADLEHGEQWTTRGYNPNPHTGFQTHVL